MIGAGVGGVELDRLLEIVEGVVDPAGLAIEIAAADIGGVVVGIELDRAVVVGERLRLVAEEAVDQRAVRIGLVKLGSSGSPCRNPSARRVPAAAAIGRSAHIVGFRILRVAVDDCRQRRDVLLRPLRRVDRGQLAGRAALAGGKQQGRQRAPPSAPRRQSLVSLRSPMAAFIAFFPRMPGTMPDCFPRTASPDAMKKRKVAAIRIAPPCGRIAGKRRKIGVRHRAGRPAPGHRQPRNRARRHRQQAFALGALAGQLAGAANGLGLFAGALLGGFS